jgi:CheY-like chemotaxis protein
MKVLVVDPDPRTAPGLQQALINGGAEVTVAPSGSFALTMLEWNRHDVVVSAARIDDMDGHELCAIIKADPGTRDVRFVLVAGSAQVTPAQSSAAGVDLVLPPGLTGGAVVSLVIRLMQGSPDRRAAPSPRRAEPAVPRLGPDPAALDRPGGPEMAPRTPQPPAAPIAAPAAGGTVWAMAPPLAASSGPTSSAGPRPAPSAKGPTPASGTFQGSLEVLDLAELTQAIAVGGKCGRLILALAGASGLLVFDVGRVVHAEYRQATGEEAFGALLAASHGDRGGRFCFIPATGGAPGPRTIDRSVDQLLLSIATAIDEKR